VFRKRSKRETERVSKIVKLERNKAKGVCWFSESELRSEGAGSKSILTGNFLLRYLPPVL
jgi:hypothetical protein